MSSARVEVLGLTEVIHDLGAVSDEIAHLDQAPIAHAAASTAARFTPHASGALGGSVRAHWASGEAVVAWGRVYAGPVLYGWPRRNIRAANTIARTLAALEDQAPDLVERGIGQVIDRHGF